MAHLAHSPRSPRRARPGQLSAFAGGLAVGLVLTGGVGWTLTHHGVGQPGNEAYANVPCPGESPTSPAPEVSPAVTAEDTYTDGRTRITVRTQVTGEGEDKVTAYVADVTLTDTTALRSAFGRDTYGKLILEIPSAMARRHRAVFAVNGDFYGFRDNGIIVRNGKTYRDEGVRRALALLRDGTAEVFDETTTTAEDLGERDVWTTLSFGPTLVQDGRIPEGIDEYEIGDVLSSGQKTSIQGRHPRTGIGVLGPNHFLVIVVDGRSPGYSRGATMTEFAQMFLDAGVKLAYNLDGGGSATMYFKGTVINQPRNGSNIQKERPSSDILYVTE